MLIGANATFGYNEIAENGQNGIYCVSNTSPNLRGDNGHNWIYGNGRAGVKTQTNSWPYLGTDSFGLYGYNHIYDNILYEIENTNYGSLKAERNYWSASSTSCVIPNNLYGLVDYIPILPMQCDEESLGPDPNIAYEFELTERYEEAIAAYQNQIALEPESNTAEFAVGGLVRCYLALAMGTKIPKLLDDLMAKYPQIITARAAKDNSLPYLIQLSDFDTAIERANELKEFYQGDQERESLYIFILSSIYELRSEGKAGVDQDKAVAYYQMLIDKFPESDFAFWAAL